MSRVCRVLPPRRHSAAFSSSKTLAPDSRAEIAATSPALPPPTTMTSLAIVTCHPELARDLGLLGLTAYCRHVSSRACEGSRLARIDSLLLSHVIPSLRGISACSDCEATGPAAAPSRTYRLRRAAHRPRAVARSHAKCTLQGPSPLGPPQLRFARGRTARTNAAFRHRPGPAHRPSREAERATRVASPTRAP